MRRQPLEFVRWLALEWEASQVTEFPLLVGRRQTILRPMVFEGMISEGMISQTIARQRVQGKKTVRIQGRA
jgi:hypothetical protein